MSRLEWLAIGSIALNATCAVAVTFRHCASEDVEALPRAAQAAASAEHAAGGAEVLLQTSASAEPRARALQATIAGAKSPVRRVDPREMSDRAVAARWTDAGF